jgi:hypothetical protein
LIRPPRTSLSARRLRAARVAAGLLLLVVDAGAASRDPGAYPDRGGSVRSAATPRGVEPGAGQEQKPALPRLPGPPPRRSEALRPAPPEPPPDLDMLLARLGEKARQYEALALRFICLESVRHSNDPPGEERRFDYMYVEAQEQRYLPYRQRHTGRLGRTIPETGLNFGFPDSYSWTLMFSPARQHIFHFKPVGQEWFSLRQAHVLEFTAPLPFTSGRTIYEWSGRVWIDAENLNFLKVEAEPGNQPERMKAELQAYRQAPRFLIFPIGKKPRGARYNITFLNEFQRISLPDQAEYREFSLDLDGAEEFEGMTSLRYSGYQFFNVDAREFLR